MIPRFPEEGHLECPTIRRHLGLWNCIEMGVITPIAILQSFCVESPVLETQCPYGEVKGRFMAWHGDEFAVYEKIRLGMLTGPFAGVSIIANIR